MAVNVGCGEYTIGVSVGALPSLYTSFVERAMLHDDIGLHPAEGTTLIVTVSRDPTSWPELVVSQRFAPGPDAAGFKPGIFLVPETARLFIGAGTRLLAYDLRIPQRLWEDYTDAGFLCWRRHGDFVILSGELELAAWDLKGGKLWSTYVEPPWTYDAGDDLIELDVMDVKSTFPIRTGPRLGRAD